MWDRIADEMQLTIPNDPDVIAYRDWYIQHPKYLRTVTERAAPFLHLITEEIDKRQMPMELVLLPIVESAYNPNARSHGNAVGLWQFLSASGQTLWSENRITGMTVVVTSSLNSGSAGLSGTVKCLF